jgi:hypothetical protein
MPKYTRSWRFSALVTTIALVLFALWFSNPPSTHADNSPRNLYQPVPVPPQLGTIFELDGNVADNPNISGDDWATLQTGNGNSIAKTVGTVPGGVAIADPKGTTIFIGGGSKDTLDVTQWMHTSGNVPDKDEITNAYAAAYNNAAGDLLVFFGADRFATNGDSQVGFWFFQQDVHTNANGTFSGSHTNGDLLVLSHFSQGGGVVAIEVYEWQNGGLLFLTSGSDCLTTPSFCAVTNNSSLASPWPYTPKMGTAGVLPVGAFFEGGINLTALGVSNSCFSSFLAETRSSTSTTAQLKDFVTGQFTLVPDISAGPDALLTCAVTSAQLTATTSIANPSFHWDGPAGGISGSADQATITVILPGTYTVTVSGATGCSNTDTAVVTQDIAPPNVSAGDDGELTCTTTSLVLHGSSSTPNVTYSWSGPGIVGAADQADVTVNAAGNYLLTVTSTVNGCPNSDTAVVTSDIAPPSAPFSKTSADGSALSVLLTSAAQSNAVPAGTLHFQFQSCVLNCGVDASWSNLGADQLGNTLTFSNFAIAAPSVLVFNLGSGNGAGDYSAQLFIANLRVKVTDAGNGCTATSDPVIVKKLLAVDP